MQGILPVTGALILFFLGGWTVWLDYDVNTLYSYTMFTVPGLHWQVGGPFGIVFLSIVAGLIFFIYCRATGRAFFKKQTLTRATPTLSPDTHLPGPSPGQPPLGWRAAS